MQNKSVGFFTGTNAFFLIKNKKKNIQKMIKSSDFILQSCMDQDSFRINLESLFGRHPLY